MAFMSIHNMFTLFLQGNQIYISLRYMLISVFSYKIGLDVNKYRKLH